jgi:hypothetical protein
MKQDIITGVEHWNVSQTSNLYDLEWYLPPSLP